MGVLVIRGFGEKVGFEVSWDGRVYKENHRRRHHK